MIETIRTILALSQLPGIGRVKLKKILSLTTWDGGGSPSLADMINLGDFLPKQLNVARERADQIVEQCESLGISMHIFGLPSYPSLLTRLAEPPAMLFSLGHFDPNRRPR